MIDKIYNEDCIEGMKRIPFEPMWEQFKLIEKCLGMNGYRKKN